MRFFHITNDLRSTIIVPAWNRPYNTTNQPVVWAIDEKELACFLLPMDCPRVVLTMNQESLINDIKHYNLSPGRPILYYDAYWDNMLANNALTVYEVSGQAFKKIDKDSSIYISDKNQTQIGTKTIVNLKEAISSRGVELRATTDLKGIYIHAINTSLTTAAYNV